MSDEEIRALLATRRCGAPSASASDLNKQILDLLHQHGSLSTTALAESAQETTDNLAGRLNALTRLGLLQLREDERGVAVYSLSPTGTRARGIAYLSIHEAQD
jgi:hypothetical protein